MFAPTTNAAPSSREMGTEGSSERNGNLETQEVLSMGKVWIPPIGRMVYRDGKGYWETQRPGCLLPLRNREKAFKEFLKEWEASKPASYCFVGVTFKDGRRLMCLT